MDSLADRLEELKMKTNSLRLKTSQAFSMDIMIALVVFIGTIFVIYSVIGGNKDVKVSELEDDASKVLKNVVSESSSVGIVDGIEVNITKLEELLGKDYSEIKKQIRVKNEFCIFLEDEDGNIIYITTDPDRPGVGSDKINISDIPCA